MNPPPAPPDDATAAGAAPYTKRLLSGYDVFVLGLSNSFIWRCPTRTQLAFYNEHVTGHHLDVGVGSGYYLDKCSFPVSQPTIALADLNENSLAFTARRIARYHPTVHVANVLEPMDVTPAGFDSIGLNYLLHCLPGSMSDKGSVFRHVRPLVNPEGGVVFGSTILGAGVRHHRVGRALMRLYNERRIFCNLNDSAVDLEAVLRESFRDHTVRIEGCVALFVGRT